MKHRLFWAAIFATFLISCLNVAFGRWKAEYAQSSPEERAWYERQKTTPETRERLHADWYQFCCDHADTVVAEFGKRGNQWFFRTADDGDWHSIPDDTVQADVQTPHGRAILFVDVTGHNFGPVCFFPGATGS